jgi:hypothetical protein
MAPRRSRSTSTALRKFLLLVTADVVQTVILEFNLANMTALGVLVPTFLSWSLVVEIAGRRPWQPERKAEPRKSE